MLRAHVEVNRFVALSDCNGAMFNGFRTKRSMNTDSLTRPKHYDLALAPEAVNVARAIKTLLLSRCVCNCETISAEVCLLLM